MEPFLITHYSKKGDGVASYRSKSLIVPQTIREETVIPQQIDRYKRGFLARKATVLSPSIKRTLPKCAHAAVCGGCSWQHLRYQAQVEEKAEKIRALFAPLTTVSPQPVIIGAQHWQYRNKMEYTFSQNKKGEHFLGLLQSFSRGKVENLQECPLAPSWFTTALIGVRDWWKTTTLRAYHACVDEGALQTLMLRSFGSCKLIQLTVSGNAEYGLSRRQILSFKEAVLRLFPNEDPSLFLQLKQIRKGSPTQYFEMHLSGPATLKNTLCITYKEETISWQCILSPSAFFQPNTYTAPLIYQQALTLTAPTKEDILYDLYAGTAVVSLCFSPYIKKSIAIESNPYALCDAADNVRSNGSKNIELIKGDVATVIEERVDLPMPTLVIADPPREGLKAKALALLQKLKPKKLLYISCNPQTQVADLAHLQNSFSIKKIVPIDQFPHTPHIENLVYLEKKNA